MSCKRHVDAMKDDGAEWIVYDHSMDIDEWLHKYRPSVISKDDGIGWISVSNHEDNENDDSEEDDTDSEEDDGSEDVTPEVNPIGDTGAIEDKLNDISISTNKSNSKSELDAVVNMTQEFAEACFLYGSRVAAAIEE